MEFVNYATNPSALNYILYSNKQNQDEEERRRKKRNEEDEERRRKKRREEEENVRRSKNTSNQIQKTNFYQNTNYVYVKEPKKFVDPTKQKHYIYLIRTKEDVLHNRNIYKIGKTIINVLTASLTMLSTLGTGIEVISVRQCTNSIQVEEDILVMFNEKFQKIAGKDILKQRFKGNVDEMDHTISQIIRSDRKKTSIPKEIDNLVLS